MEFLPLIIQLLSGAVGGNVAGKLMPKASLGGLGNSAAGILGGGIGGTILGMVGMSAGGGMDVAGIVGSLLSGGVGGGVVMTVIGLIKKVLVK